MPKSMPRPAEILRHAADRPLHAAAWAGGGLLVAVALAAAAWGALSLGAGEVSDDGDGRGREAAARPPAGGTSPTREPEAVAVTLSASQQEAIGLKVAAAEAGQLPARLRATGRVVPDETRYAYITPRAAGVVRSVAANVGQAVHAGDLLAQIDSARVAEARLALVTSLQELEIARTRAQRENEVYEATMDLIAMLKDGRKPSAIDEAMEGRAVGEDRERLMTAYADFRLARAVFERSESLREGDAVSLEKYQQALAEYEAAVATYQALMDRVGFEARIENSKAQQVLRQAETAVRVARERLRVLGVRPDGTEPEVRGGRVVGVRPDGTLPESDDPKRRVTEMAPEDVLPAESDGKGPGVEPIGTRHAESPVGDDSPLSTYSIWAPFDGIVLERELVVPGVYVDTTDRIFQIADLSRVWVEVKVQESDFAKLRASDGGTLRFTSPAYPGEVFEGRVIYTGDLVDEQTRAILLLAEAPNNDRRLKPGMFVEVEVIGNEGRPAIFIPRTALLTEGPDRFVFVRTGPERFERRRVRVAEPTGRTVAVLDGLEPGTPVVTRGAFKLKAVAQAEG